MTSEGDEPYVNLLQKLEEQEAAVTESIVESYNCFCNNRPDNTLGSQSPEEIEASEIKFIEAMQEIVANDYDPLTFDPTKNFLETMSLLRNEIHETEKMISFKRAKLIKADNSIDFYKDSISSVENALKEFTAKGSKPTKSEAKEKQLKNAKNKFFEFKSDMNHVIETLFPKQKNGISEFLGNICANHFSGTEYTEASEDIDINIVEILMLARIIAPHPHECRLFKLSL